MKQTYIPIPNVKQSLEAVQYTGTNKSEILDVLGKDASQLATTEGGTLLVKTSAAGFLPVEIGQYVIKDPGGSIDVWAQPTMRNYMTAPIAVEAEFQKQQKAEDDKKERAKILQSGDALFGKGSL